MTPEHIEVLDLRGLKCPLPVLRARKKLGTMEAGSRLQLVTTDPLAVIDIPHMCGEDGHVVESPLKTETGHQFIITVGE
jgi:tRNA 2-thiouridine synthesizing protein A